MGDENVLPAELNQKDLIWAKPDSFSHISGVLPPLHSVPKNPGKTLVLPVLPLVAALGSHGGWDCVGVWQAHIFQTNMIYRCPIIVCHLCDRCLFCKRTWNFQKLNPPAPACQGHPAVKIESCLLSLVTSFLSDGHLSAVCWSDGLTGL